MQSSTCWEAEKSFGGQLRCARHSVVIPAFDPLRLLFASRRFARESAFSQVPLLVACFAFKAVARGLFSNEIPRLRLGTTQVVIPNRPPALTGGRAGSRAWREIEVGFEQLRQLGATLFFVGPCDADGHAVAMEQGEPQYLEDGREVGLPAFIGDFHFAFVVFRELDEQRRGAAVNAVPVAYRCCSFDHVDAAFTKRGANATTANAIAVDSLRTPWHGARRSI